MKDLCVWVICICTVIFGSCYIRQIRNGKAKTTTSTWIILLVGCALSFVTYLIAENKDLKSGIMNTVDMVYVTVILYVVYLQTGRKIQLESFEKNYLAGAGMIVVYGVVTGDAWKSNVLTQILMSFAYLPMYHKLFLKKEKTDSYFAWLPPAFTAAISLYPSIHDGNALATIYSARALFFCSLTSLLMFYYQLRAKVAASIL